MPDSLRRNKNIKLIVILAVLLSLSLWLGSREEKKSNLDVDQRLFSIEDIEGVDKIVLQNDVAINNLILKSGYWQLNAKYRADQNLVELLLAVFNRVEIQRSVSKKLKPEVINELNTNGIGVEVFSQGELLQKFLVGGNATKTNTYFARTVENPFIITLPGYNNYVAGIFELTTNQWRDRLIFSSTWRSLKSLSISYLGLPQNDILIDYKNDQLVMEGVNTLDTVSMLSYIENFNQFHAIGFIDSGEYPRFDSLLTTDVAVTIALNDIDSKKNQVLQLYPRIPNDQYYLGKLSDGQMTLFDVPSIEVLLKVGEDFDTLKE